MKRIALVLAVLVAALVVAQGVVAQNVPTAGTWKLNVEKSKFGKIKTVKSLTRTAEADGDGVKVSYEGEFADGSPLNFMFSAKYDGKDYAVTGEGKPFDTDTIALKRLDAKTVESTLKKDGTIVAKVKSAVSKDGKTTTITYTDAQGKSTGDVGVYDKQ
jgi:hypothetical protein